MRLTSTPHFLIKHITKTALRCGMNGASFKINFPSARTLMKGEKVHRAANKVTSNKVSIAPTLLSARFKCKSFSAAHYPLIRPQHQKNTRTLYRSHTVHALKCAVRENMGFLKDIAHYTAQLHQVHRRNYQFRCNESAITAAQRVQQEENQSAPGGSPPWVSLYTLNILVESCPTGLLPLDQWQCVTEKKEKAPPPPPISSECTAPT
jgi:hypothetical protein